MSDSDKSDKTPSAGTDDWIPAPFADILKSCTASDIPPAWRAWPSRRRIIRITVLRYGPRTTISPAGTVRSKNKRLPARSALTPPDTSE